MAAKTNSNPLFARIGTTNGKNTNGKKSSDIENNNKMTNGSNAKKNPLAQALMKGKVNTMSLSERIRPASQANVNSSRSSKPQQSKIQKQPQKPAVVAPVSFAKYVQKAKKQHEKKPDEKQKQSKPLKPKKGQIKSTAQDNTSVISIKNTVEKKLLQIKNLEIGTTSADLNRALASFGSVTSISVRDLPSGSTTAEVEFSSQKELQGVAARLNGAVADGRVIQAKITTKREL